VGTALGAAEPDKAGFSQARVAVLGNQLLVLPGAPGSTNFESVSNGDQTTVSQLQLRARYPVRVRVNGAENIDGEGFEMPEVS
jgi:hypothetical protein